MANTINADNGVISGITGIRTTADNTGNLALQSNGVTVLTVNTANTVAVGSGGITFSDNTTITSHAAPNVTVYKSGSGTYTTPTGAKWLQVKMAGGGGGGGGSGTGNQTGGSAGNASTFGSSLLTCNGGSATTNPNISSAGGSATIGSGASGLNLSGGNGQGCANPGVYVGVAGGMGGSNPFGGAGTCAFYFTNGDAGVANTGAGGAGGAMWNNGGTYGGAGGGAGGYIEAIISSPSSTYAYAVGTGGSGGGAGTNGYAGGAGAAGVIFITAYF